MFDLIILQPKLTPSNTNPETYYYTRSLNGSNERLNGLYETLHALPESLNDLHETLNS